MVPQDLELLSNLRPNVPVPGVQPTETFLEPVHVVAILIAVLLEAYAIRFGNLLEQDFVELGRTLQENPNLGVIVLVVIVAPLMEELAKARAGSARTLGRPSTSELASSRSWRRRIAPGCLGVVPS